MSQGTALYDADCGFCTRTARRIPLLRVDVDLQPLQNLDLRSLGIDTQRAMIEMPFVQPNGSVVYGHHAWAAILRAGPWPLRLIGSALDSRALSPVAERVYHWVSTHRSRLPGGTPACEVNAGSRHP